MLISAVSCAIVILGRFTKFLALKYLPSHESIPVVSNIFHLSLVRNPGIAFGLFGNGAPGLIVIIILCLVMLILLSIQMRKARLSQRISLAFILGGAAGNLIDRLLFGHVVDFLDFRIWPVFNLADSFITVGVFAFLLAAAKSK